LRRILFIAAHRPNRSPSQRFRFEQYIGFLESKGYSCDYSWLLNEKDDKRFYSPGHYIRKTYIVFKSWIKRCRDLIRASRYDVIFIQREAFMTGSTWFERQFAKRSKVIFDFDDAIWKLDISDANKRLSFLKRPGKTQKLIRSAHLVIAGNAFLAEFAKEFNRNVKIIPTTIDTDYHLPKPKTSNGLVTIGWTGSLTTIKHFRLAEKVLEKIRKKYGDRVRYKVIGDKNYVNESLGIRGIAWNRKTEVEDLNGIDIGIMPLPDDEWARGKCGFKGLQYMAMEIAPVISPVGVNTEIVQHGENGFLASTEEEWINYISMLIDDPELRHRIGKAARRTVIERYSVESCKQDYLDAVSGLSG
jgi:glycosyltransferase involved in cell wall biosynthesis